MNYCVQYNMNLLNYHQNWKKCQFTDAFTCLSFCFLVNTKDTNDLHSICYGSQRLQVSMFFKIASFVFNRINSMF